MKTQFCLIPLIWGGASLAAADDAFLLRGATIHPVTSGEIQNGAILVREGRIAELGARITAPKGARVIDVKGLHIYPGMIDGATQLGLSEISSVTETNDIIELGLFKPQLRALTAINPASEHFPVTRVNGITTALVQPGGGIVIGQAALIHLDGWTTDDIRVRAPAAMRIDYPQTASVASGGRAAVPASHAERKRRYEQQVRELDDFFDAARRYQKAKAASAASLVPDLKLEAMLPVLEGKVPVLIRAEREKTIRDALRFAEKQKIRMLLLHGRDAWKLASELKAKNVPVILGPTFTLPAEEDDPYDRSFSIPAELHKAGVKIAFATFAPTAGSHSRNLPYEASAAVAFGLPYEEALKAVTINPAQFFGADSDVGSLEKGKLADLIVTDGDPLETRTQIKQMFIAGKPVDLENKHHRLYEKYLNRP